MFAFPIWPPLLAVLTLIYAVGAARARPFWFDEIYLLMAAKADSLPEVWRIALNTDASPPMPHVMAHVAIVRRRKGDIFGFSALLLTIVTDAYSYATDARAYGPRNPFTEEPALAEALKQGPVVISDGQLHLLMWHYAPSELKPRLVFLVDEAAAVKYMGFDTLDKSGGALRVWSGVTAPAYDEFVENHREFLLYRNLARPEWVTPLVLDEGASVEVRSVGFTASWPRCG